MDWLNRLVEHPAAFEVGATAVGLLLIVFLRRALVGIVQQSGLPTERRRRLLVHSRNAAIVAFMLVAVAVWAAQLQVAALSIAAIAVAIVLATKELILCLSGALLRMSAQGLSLGDRIELTGVRGDVIDIGPLTTTMLEVGSGNHIHKGTGRTIVVPNSTFLSTPVTHETFTDNYVLHATTVPLHDDDDWEGRRAAAVGGGAGGGRAVSRGGAAQHGARRPQARCRPARGGAEGCGCNSTSPVASG